jgi:tetratricopeptide (TPR) repeat protein
MTAGRSKIALLCIVGVTALAGSARATDMPTAALRRSFEAERAAGAERSEPLARALLYTAASATETKQLELRQLALQADPALVTPHLAAARDAARKLDFGEAGAALLDAAHAARLDATEEARWMRRAVHGVHGVLGATLVTLALLLMLRASLLARHALGERLGSYTAATLLWVVPVIAALVTSVALGTLLMLAMAATFMRRSERVCAAILCLLLAGGEWGIGFLAPHAVLLDPRTQTAQIARLASGPNSEIASQLAALPQRPAPVELVLGLQSRRRGELEAARDHYIAALRADTTAVEAYVNLANLFFRTGQYEHAAAGYRAAQALAPQEPLPRYNLGQTYIRMLHYGESDGELRAAAERGMPEVSKLRALWRDEACPVLDMTVSKATLGRLARAELAAHPQLGQVVLQSWHSQPWRSVRRDILPWLLFAVAVLLFSKFRLNGVAGVCPGCRTIVCAHCAHQPPVEFLCNTCLLARPRGAPRMMMPEDEAVAPTPKRRISLAVGRWVAPLFPGSADVARGAPFAAAGALLVAWACLVSCAALVDRARLGGAVGPMGADGDLFRIALVIFFVAWLPGLWRSRRREPVVRVPVRPQPPGLPMMDE